MSACKHGVPSFDHCKECELKPQDSRTETVARWQKALLQHIQFLAEEPRVTKPAIFMTAGEAAELLALLKEPRGAPTPCPLCNGTGTRLLPSFADSSKDIARSCSACKGSGYLAAQPAQPDPEVELGKQQLSGMYEDFKAAKP